MGHTVAQWRDKTARLLRDVEQNSFSAGEIDETGIRPALAEHSTNRPQVLVVEIQGTNTDTYDLPAGWLPGFSHLERVEFPARQSPPIWLDTQSWNLVRKTGSLGTEQIQLDRKVGPNDYVRWWFTAPWPFPTDTAGDDPLDDYGFEAVTALAASLCCTALSVQAARRRQGTLSGDLAADNRPDQLQTVARTYRAVYLRYLGIDDTSPSTVGPASASMDFDPQYWSMFHGGRQ